MTVMAEPRRHSDPPGTARQRVLFVGGLGRSGSTLLEKLLNELPETRSVGETLHLWERGIRDAERCGCGEEFADCPQWQAIGAAAFGAWDRVDLDDVIDLRWRIDRSRRLPQIFDAIRRGTQTPEQARYVEHLSKVLHAAAQLDDGPTVLLESSKHLSTAALLATDPTLDVRVVHLVRDPRGVAYSWTKTVARPEADGSMMPTYSPARTAMRWVTDNLGFEALHALGVPMERVRYEDLLADPVGVLRRLTALADLPGTSFDFVDGAEVHVQEPMHSIAGNPMRFGGDRMTLRLDDAWRTKLPAKDRRTVTAMCAPLLKRYGYRLR